MPTFVAAIFTAWSFTPFLLKIAQDLRLGRFVPGRSILVVSYCMGCFIPTRILVRLVLELLIHGRYGVGCSV